MSKESKKVNDFNNEITVENMINELQKSYSSIDELAQVIRKNWMNININILNKFFILAT